MAKSSGNNQAQFTYDFGIAIAQSTVNKVARLTGATVTLASAFYALQQTAKEYVSTLKTNILRFGGLLSTTLAIEQAQNRIIKGQSFFSINEQLAGMNKLLSVGVDAQKEFTFVSKAAHAMGRSFTEFSGAIQQGISGNMSALVEMGLMTERSTRMFDKYHANTVMRQQAILNFVKSHKGLQNAIKNDFVTIQDQILRLKTVWQTFLRTIIGNPKDPNSLYGQIVSATKMLADAFSRNMVMIRRYGYAIGHIMGWVIKQVGHFTIWLGRKIKGVISSVWTLTDNFQNQTRSMLVWLEFWKLKIVDFFKKYKKEIKAVLYLLVAYTALKGVFVISDLAFMSIRRYKGALRGAMALQRRYRRMTGVGRGTSMAAFMPRGLRRFFIGMSKRFANLGVVFSGVFAKIFRGSGASWARIFSVMPKFSKFLAGMRRFFVGFFPFILRSFKHIGRGLRFGWSFLKQLPRLISIAFKAGKGIFAIFKASNPIGWILLAIDLFILLYKKVEIYRKYVNGMFHMYTQFIRLIWNAIMWLYVQIRIGIDNLIEYLPKLWNNIVEKVKNVFAVIGDFAGKWFEWLFSVPFSESKLGKWFYGKVLPLVKKVFKTIGDFLKKWVIDPISKIWDKIKKLWELPGKIGNFFSKGADAIADSTQASANAHGYTVPVWNSKGTQPDLSKDYLSIDGVKSLFGGNNDSGATTTTTTTTGGKNPLVGDNSLPDFGGFGDMGGGGTTNNITVSKGAIQINVPKDSGIDETKLAKMIEKILVDLERQNKLRKGK